jgi:hypothetical protein
LRFALRILRAVPLAPVNAFFSLVY